MRPKRIFLLWLQGWANAPPGMRACLESWRRRNPDHEVHALDARTLQDWVDWGPLHDRIGHLRVSRAGFSDMVRLALLAQHGGVWADATTYCRVPLRYWLPDSGFYAFDARHPRRRVSSWFLAGEPNDLVTERWHGAMLWYWMHRGRARSYYWVHGLFANKCRQDPEFAAAWETLAPMTNHEPHLFHRRGFGGPVDHEITDHVFNMRSPLHKLTHRRPLHRLPRTRYLFNHA